MPLAGSIAVRLVALFTLASALLLGAVVAIVYRGVALHLDDEHMHLLAEVVRLVRASPASQSDAWVRGTSLPLTAEGGLAGAQGAAKYSFRIVSSSGVVTAESKGMGRIPLAAFAAVPVAAPVSPTAGRPWRAPDGTRFLLGSAVQLAGGAGGEPATVQVALDVSPDDGLLAELRFQGLLLLAIGVLASGLAGVAIVRLGLRPIGRMATAMGSVSAGHLGQRLDRYGFPLELRGLVDAFGAMLDRLDRAFADISAYSGNLAHELRTPLGNLRGGIEVALLRSRSVAEYRDVLSSGLEELDRLARMVDALLFLARADRREAGVVRTHVSLAAEARGVAEFFAALAEEKRVALRVTGAAEADLDAELLRRALGNLVANALRHARPGGSVTVAVSDAETGGVQVVVADDGCGIAPADLPHVFERFYRGKRCPGADAGGSGLGLAIVRSIVELHDGRAEIVSTVGAGTTVTLRFPR